MDITLTNYMKEQLELIDLKFKRYMYSKMPWDARLVGMIGQLRDETGGMRGLGKTEKVYLDNPNIILHKMSYLPKCPILPSGNIPLR